MAADTHTSLPRARRRIEVTFERLISGKNHYTRTQKAADRHGTLDHYERDAITDDGDALLAQVAMDPALWAGERAIDFGCGKRRNVRRLLGAPDCARIDDFDLSPANVAACAKELDCSRSMSFQLSGTDLQPSPDDSYDFVLSAITLQPIPVYSIRKRVLAAIYCVMRSGGDVASQRGFGIKLSHPSGVLVTKILKELWSARGTNGDHDVQAANAQQVINDLHEIRFQDLAVTMKPSTSVIRCTDWRHATAQEGTSAACLGHTL